jgi:hypothetical protein
MSGVADKRVCDLPRVMISFDGEGSVDYLLNKRLKLEIVVYLACPLLVFVLPKDSNVDPECSPADPRQLNYLITVNRI